MKLTRILATAGVLGALAVGGAVVAAPASAYPAGTTGQATGISATVIAPGASVTITVTATTPGNLTMYILSAPVVIGRGTTGANGNGSVTGTIPAGYSGPHTLQVVGAGGEVYSYDVTIASSGGGNGSPNGGGSGSGNGGGLANTGAAVTGIGVLGGVLVAGGVFFVVAGRRRTANQTSV